MSPTADSQVHIEALIEQAGNSLRQQLDEMHRDSADGDSDKSAHRRAPDPRQRLPWWRLAFK